MLLNRGPLDVASAAATSAADISAAWNVGSEGPKDRRYSASEILSDRLREEIAERGWVVIDTPQGQVVKRSSLEP